MKSFAVLAVVLVALGCGREDQRDNAAAPAVQPREAAGTPASPGKLPADWKAQRTLPQRSGAGPFEGRQPAAPIRHRAQPPREEAPAAQAVATAPPPPFAYVGKLARGQEGYAVLTGDGRVFVVRAGDALPERYRVQSVSEKEVVLFNLDFGIAQSLAFSSGSASNAVLPTAAVGAGATDDVSLLVFGPSQVAVGEQFTLTVSLDSGFNATLDTGKVEVRYDPKVLEIPGQSPSTGAARIDITGAYAGHPAPATLQFRVVAAAPTATEIRVVPTNISDSDGRNVGVNTPQAHRLMIVRAAPSGG
jgi:Tfp pilus assembly protein PilP